MADVLSQNEIDALLKQLSTGELDADDFTETKSVKVKEYDFSRPAKFSKEHLRTLEIIFEHYGRLLSSNLPAYLRKNVQVEVMNSEAVTYSEFSNALSNPVLLGVVNMAPLSGNIIIEIATNLGYAIIDRLLGGVGEPLEKKREFSEIELSILEKIFTILIDLLREPWTNVVEIHPYLERIETNPQFAQIISPTEMIAIVTVNINIGGVEGLMNICLPYLTLEDVMDKLNTKYWFSTMQDRDETSYADVIETAINRALIPVSAELGKSSLTVMDFINLQVGDVIKLNRKIEDELDIYVGNIVKFKALPGSFNDDYAVQFQAFNPVMNPALQQENIDLIMDVPLEVSVVLGRTRKSIKEILEFAPGTIIELDKLAGEPIDVMVNQKLVAKGEVVVIEESFGIRITEIIKEKI